MKVVQTKKPKNYFSYGGVVPFRTQCPFTSLPISYSPVSTSRELLHPTKRRQYMNFSMFTYLLHRLSTTGSIPRVVFDPMDDVQLDSALYELTKYKDYQKDLEYNKKKEEKYEETQNVESQESEEGPEYSEESSRTDSSIRRTSVGRKRTRRIED